MSDLCFHFTVQVWHEAVVMRVTDAATMAHCDGVNTPSCADANGLWHRHADDMTAVWLISGVLLVLAVPLLLVVLRFEATQNRRGLIPAKTMLSALFVIVGLLQSSELGDYKLWIMLGLAFSLVGDFALAFPQRAAFLVGLVAFLVGHVWYVVAFAGQGQIAWWVFVVWFALIAVAGGVFAWLRPHLGKMVGPVVAYMVVITTMVGAAVAVVANSDLGGGGRVVVILGAVLFYLSDLMVARDRFVDKNIVNRRIGLPLYYSGQFLIALSIGALALAT